jgi:hypothetical protein
MQARNRPTRLSSPVFVKAGPLSPRALYRRGRFIAAGALSPRALYRRGRFIAAGALSPRALYRRGRSIAAGATRLQFCCWAKAD